jgi:S1-C subfamily serine protease
MRQPSGSYGLLYLGIIVGTLVLIGVLVAGWFVVQSFTIESSVISSSETGNAPLPAPPTPLVSSGANELEAQIEAVYQSVSPGVVNITSRSFELDFFLRPMPREGSGSGFFYDDQGHIITNYHVVQGAEELQVTLADERSLTAQLVGVDPSNDLAVIRVDLPPSEITVVPLGDSTRLRVGQFVVAIGNPFGLERTLTVGVVSSLGRIIESPNQRFIGEVIQTDASINPGNSGGPLLNLDGEAIGVNSAILSPSGASAGIGFTIPAQTVQRVVPSLIATGRYPQPSLDVQAVDLTPRVAELLKRAGMNVPVEQGVLVVETMPGGAAAQAGIQGGDRVVRVGNALVPVGGDIIVAIHGEDIDSQRDLIAYLGTRTEAGQTVDVTIIRNGERLVVPVTLGELDVSRNR